MYIFRNYTIENLFDESVRFSGYDNLSDIPTDDCYVWFYTAPIAPAEHNNISEIRSIAEKLQFVADSIPETSDFYILTLEDLNPQSISDTDRAKYNEAVSEVNRLSWNLSEKRPNIKVIDLRDFLSRHPSESWINWKFYFLSQMAISPALAPSFREWWAGKMEEFKRPRRKCIVLDLDNTLWSGVLGEDGISGIRMSGDYPGNAFMYFQESLVALAESGVILTVCSKNNESDVLELWDKNPFVKLGPKHISAYRINWENKADNIRGLARELNIGLDSMVFVDDNPTERELVRQQLPEVAVPEFPKRPYLLMEFFSGLVSDYFRTYRLTSEDLDKTEQYKANAQRAAEQSKFADLTDFIRSLDIRMEISTGDEFNIPRIAQMTQKTNQFNLTTRRYSESDIARFINSGDDVFCVSVSDKYGDNGITGAVIVRKEGITADIDTLLLSCRILGKDIEYVFLNSVLNHLSSEGIRIVRATYMPTLKNGQVSDFYSKAGFTLVGESDGIKRYEKELTDRISIPQYYKIIWKNR